MDERLKTQLRSHSVAGEETEAYAARLEARRTVRMGSAVLFSTALVLTLSASVVRLDSAASAKGKVIVAGNRQTVQHRDGGIVSSLSVHEGDRVKAGQTLLTLDSEELEANIQSTANQVIEQKALQARLMAELTHAKTIRVPAEFNKMSNADRNTAQAAMTLQSLEFSHRASAIAESGHVLQSQIAQAAAQVTGFQRQVNSSQLQADLIQKEIDSLGPLYASGLVPASRMRSLERSKAQISGDLGSNAANAARSSEEVGEKRARIASLIADRDAEDAKEYRDAEMQLSELEPKLVALRQQLGRTSVKAPVSGQVVGLTVFTVQGVVTPGQKLLDIVPDDAPLVLEAQFSPSDADDVRIGQKAEVRVTAFHDRGLPKLQATITKVSADSFTEEKSGAAYFRIEASVSPSELQKITALRGADAGLKAGLPVEILIPLRPRTALSYLLDPLTHALWTSFRQK